MTYYSVIIVCLSMETELVYEVDLPGSIRVGKIIYEGGKAVYPSYSGYTPILVLTKSSPYGSLGPYVLKNERGQIMENVWQFSKLYPWVPASKQTFSRWDGRVIWEHPQETHIDDNKQPTAKYWKWREKGLYNQEAVRYPVGNTPHRKLCMGCLSERDTSTLLPLADARREIYLYEYVRLVKRQPQYRELKTRLSQGEKLLIIEVDGPHEESLEYYKDSYGVDDTFIENRTMLACYRNLNIMLYDDRHSFGHGYCLAIALRDWECDFSVSLYAK